MIRIIIVRVTEHSRGRACWHELGGWLTSTDSVNDGSGRCCRQRPHFSVRRLGLLLLFFSMLLLTGTAAGLELGPLFMYSEAEEETQAGREGAYWSALGPFFERKTEEHRGETYSFAAMPRPFYSHHHVASGKKGGRDMLWPLGFTRYSSRGGYAFIFPFIHTEKKSEQIDSAFYRRWWLFPLLFTGHDDESEWYHAVFPVGGSINRIAGYDQVSFVLFPLYLRLHRSGIDSKFLLWPIFHRATGKGISKWHVFPVYGRKENDGLKRQFFLWPFFHIITSNEDYNHGNGFFIFPLFGAYRRNTEQFNSSMWTFLWPLFSRRSTPNEEKLNCPWPFIQFERKKDRDGEARKLYFWPFWGERDAVDRRYTFYLWPLVQQWDRKRQDEIIRRRVFFNFIYGSRRRLPDNDDESGEGDDRIKDSWRHLWPLYRWEKEGESERLWALALWHRAESGAIVRNYAPFWRLFTLVKSEDQVAMQFAWGLWRFEKQEQEKIVKTSLFPLFDYRKDSSSWSVSFFKGLLEKGSEDGGQGNGKFLWLFSWGD
ncbi:MAG: hypothetical protein ACOCQP_01695 [Lentisphaeria bacterium]